MEKHEHIYSRGIDEPRPRKCKICGEPEPEPKIPVPAWTEAPAMKVLGYSLVKDDGVYAKYQNDAGTVCPSYGIMPRGKRIVYFNRGYDVKQGIFVGIREDGDSRNVFNGICDTEVTFRLILNAVR